MKGRTKKSTAPKIWNTQQFCRYTSREWIVLHIPTYQAGICELL